VFHAGGVGDVLVWIRNRWIFILALVVALFVVCCVLPFIVSVKRENKKIPFGRLSAGQRKTFTVKPE
jgi:hypothetical protein